MNPYQDASASSANRGSGTSHTDRLQLGDIVNQTRETPSGVGTRSGEQMSSRRKAGAGTGSGEQMSSRRKAGVGNEQTQEIRPAYMFEKKGSEVVEDGNIVNQTRETTSGVGTGSGEQMSSRRKAGAGTGPGEQMLSRRAGTGPGEQMLSRRAGTGSGEQMSSRRKAGAGNEKTQGIRPACMFDKNGSEVVKDDNNVTHLRVLEQVLANKCYLDLRREFQMNKPRESDRHICLIKTVRRLSRMIIS
jgi:hypothetical protein